MATMKQCDRCRNTTKEAFADKWIVVSAFKLNDSHDMAEFKRELCEKCSRALLDFMNPPQEERTK